MQITEKELSAIYSGLTLAQYAVEAMEPSSSDYASDKDTLSKAWQAWQDLMREFEYMQNRAISVVWDTGDVQQVRPDLNDEQALEVLHAVKHSHDANNGITWDTLEYAAERLFPE